VSGPQRPFDPAELRVPGEPEPIAAELADALATARELEAIASNAGLRPSDGFEDRVMAAIATEPAPRLVAAPVSAVRGGRVGAFLVTVRESWAVASRGGRPMAVRAQALAFVLLVVLATGAMAGVTAVTVGALVGPNGVTVRPDQTPAPTQPSDNTVSPTSLEPTESTESLLPTDSAGPGETESAEPGDTAEPAKAGQPGETQQPTRNLRQTATPGGHETPQPNDTAEPSETPTGSDDHGSGSIGTSRDG